MFLQGKKRDCIRTASLSNAMFTACWNLWVNFDTIFSDCSSLICSGNWKMQKKNTSRNKFPSGCQGKGRAVTCSPSMIRSCLWGGGFPGPVGGGKVRAWSGRVSGWRGRVPNDTMLDCTRPPGFQSRKWNENFDCVPPFALSTAFLNRVVQKKRPLSQLWANYRYWNSATNPTTLVFCFFFFFPSSLGG